MAVDITTIYPHEVPGLVDEVDTLGLLDVPVLEMENVAVGGLSEDIGMMENI